jgi:uncharacterized damage-inducible protein DinB
MPLSHLPLISVFEGWGGYRQSITNAVAPLTAEQLNWRPAPEMRSVGELARHIALGSIEWFLRMDAPGSLLAASEITAWNEDFHGNKYIDEKALSITSQAVELTHWLEISGQMINKTLNIWTIADLNKTYRHTWRGDTYAISRQWTLWRIMAHDLHHGGELAILLGMQGLKNFELGDLGGHIIDPPLAEDV